MIRFKNLFLRYVRQYYALYDINLDIASGENIAFVGEEDSGKTSLLRILVKLEKATKGELYIKDIPIKKVNFVNDVQLGFLPSKPVFFENKTVYENLVYVLKLHKLQPAQMESAINNCLIEFNIESLKDSKISSLTLFEKYLVAVARISLRNLEILVIDEVLDNLKGEEKEKMLEIISKKYLNSSTTCILATNNEQLARSLCSRIVFFEHGSIIKEQKEDKSDSK